MSVPGSNAFPERIFSLMNSKWTCDRNRMSVEPVKAELQVFANYTFDCREFYAFAIDDRQQRTTQLPAIPSIIGRTSEIRSL